MLADYHIHVAAHGEFEYSKNRVEAYVQNALQQGINAIGFCEHEEWADRIDRGLIAETVLAHPGLEIAVGLEADFIPGREEQIQFLSKQHFDYIIGSVHFIEGWNFDHPKQRNGFAQQDIDQIYRQYFDLVNQAAQTRLFDIIGHLDLIKIWGHRPRKKPVTYYVEPVLYSIKEAGAVIEINTAGLRKVVAEIYPALDIISLIYRMGIPVTLGSDAHMPEHTGKNLAEAAAMLRHIGFKSIVKFKKRQAYEMPINEE